MTWFICMVGLVAVFWVAAAVFAVVTARAVKQETSGGFAETEHYDTGRKGDL